MKKSNQKRKSANMHIEHRIGIDFGGVFVSLIYPYMDLEHDFDTAFIIQKPREYAIEAVRSLVELVDGRVWIVSKAGEHVEGLSRRWFKEHKVYDLTGLNPEHIHFCRERKDKAGICQALGINHFIDDRQHIMQILSPVVENLYVFGDKERNRHMRSWVTLCGDWKETYSAVKTNIEDEILS